MLIYTSDVTTGKELGNSLIITVQCIAVQVAAKIKHGDQHLHFLFPNIDNRPQEKAQKKNEFHKRKGIYSGKNGHVRSQHFDSNSNLPSHSPNFLRLINFIAKKKPKVKEERIQNGGRHAKFWSNNPK